MIEVRSDLFPLSSGLGASGHLFQDRKRGIHWSHRSQWLRERRTLLKILCRLLSPQQGESPLGSRFLKGNEPSGILLRRMAVVPQEAHSLFPFRVIEIVLMGRSPYLGHLMFEGAQGSGDRKKGDGVDRDPFVL